MEEVVGRYECKIALLANARSGAVANLAVLNADNRQWRKFTPFPPVLPSHKTGVTIGASLLTICPMRYWLVKQEPDTYSWADLVNDGRTAWTGVRNFQARNNLRAMKRGDCVLFYHSVTDKHVMGYARVEREAYSDPTATEGDWSCVDVAPVKALRTPVGLEAIKADKALKDILLVRQSRLSVMPLSRAQFEQVLRLGETTLK